MLLDVNLEKLRKLIESFHTLTKLRVAIFDADFREIFTYPAAHGVFCDMMNRAPQIHARCEKNARTFCAKCKDENRLICYTCHAGLTEVVAPLREGERTIGYIMFGQITTLKNKEEFAKKASSLCRDYGLDEAEFSEKIRAVPFHSMEQIEAASEIIGTITSYLYLKRIVSMRKENTLDSMTEYIKNNLSADLSVPALCKHFHISKTALYELTKEAMPEGIAGFIRSLRLETASRLILETDKPIEEIAEQVGFLDSGYFRRLFKQQYGLPANHYRKKRLL